MTRETGRSLDYNSQIAFVYTYIHTHTTKTSRTNWALLRSQFAFTPPLRPLFRVFCNLTDGKLQNKTQCNRSCGRCRLPHRINLNRNLNPSRARAQLYTVRARRYIGAYEFVTTSVVTFASRDILFLSPKRAKNTGEFQRPSSASPLETHDTRR